MGRVMADDRLRGKQRMAQARLLSFALVVAFGLGRLALAGPGQGGTSQVQPKPAPAGVKTETRAAPARTAKARPAKRTAATRASTAASKSERKEQVSSVKEGPVSAGRRDPFKPWQPAPPPGQMGAAAITGPLPPGLRGLVISQLRLGGIVRQDMTNIMIAVVANYTKRAYFLRENDQLYNGQVSKITPDSVYFKENYLDPNGRVQVREVVLRLSPSPGEGR